MPSDDIEAQDFYIELLRSREIVIEPMNQGGCFLIQRNNKPFAVFKNGNKRFHYENFIYRFSRLLGLENHAVFTIGGAIKNPRFFLPALEQYLEDENLDEERVTTEELFNGNKRTFIEDNKIDEKCLTGEIVLFIESFENGFDQLISLMMFCLSIGLRDGKSDNILQGKIIDGEDCMPERLDPDINENDFVASLHLPFLDDEPYKSGLREKLSQENVEELKRITNIWDLLLIERFLENEKIRFKDLIIESETIEISDSETSEDFLDDFIVFKNTDDESSIESFDDEGIEVVDQGNMRSYIESFEKNLNPRVSEGHDLFSKKQIQACVERIRRMQIFVQNSHDFCLLDLIRAVDPHYVRHFEACNHPNCRASSSPANFVGFNTPYETETPLVSNTRE